MSRLEPNQTYIYEKSDGITYARKIGDSPNERITIGIDHDREELFEELEQNKLWSDIHKAAKTNKALQKALERVKVIYRLSKDDPLWIINLLKRKTKFCIKKYMIGV